MPDNMIMSTAVSAIKTTDVAISHKNKNKQTKKKQQLNNTDSFLQNICWDKFSNDQDIFRIAHLLHLQNLTDSATITLFIISERSPTT